MRSIPLQFEQDNRQDYSTFSPRYAVGRLYESVGSWSDSTLQRCDETPQVKESDGFRIFQKCLGHVDIRGVMCAVIRRELANIQSWKHTAFPFCVEYLLEAVTDFEGEYISDEKFFPFGRPSYTFTRLVNGQLVWSSSSHSSYVTFPVPAESLVWQMQELLREDLEIPNSLFQMEG